MKMKNRELNNHKLKLNVKEIDWFIIYIRLQLDESYITKQNSINELKGFLTFCFLSQGNVISLAH